MTKTYGRYVGGKLILVVPKVGVDYPPIAIHRDVDKCDRPLLDLLGASPPK